MGMMTEYDVQLICMAEDTIEAVDRWNESRGHGRHGKGGRKRHRKNPVQKVVSDLGGCNFYGDYSRYL